MTKKRQRQHLNTIRYEKWKKRILQQFFGSKMCRFPFVEARPPQDGMGWAGVLYKKGIPWKIWEYCEERKKDTWRKI